MASSVTDWIEQRQTVLTVGSIALVAAYLIFQRLTGHSELDALRSLETLDDPERPHPDGGAGDDR